MATIKPQLLSFSPRVWHHWLFWVVLFLPVGLFAADSADPPSLADPVQRLQDFLNQTKTWEADFLQQIEAPEAGVPAESAGHIATAKPGRFRWDYRTPTLQTIVSDGQTIWFYEPDLAQVTVGKASRLDNTPALLLSSSAPLQTVFTWEVSVDESLNLPAVHLRPRKSGTIQEIILILYPDRDELLKLTTRDSLGHISHFTFRNMRINQPVAGDRFQFKIPPNVDIIEDRAQPSEAP
ncbi:MAG: outer membrane lipoprotein chaperone LolA [Magnetococcales bacterium]|nr:outer membrane lipoprotein chaperone LolA [Magnetococcales bacterium]